ncbi:hypothetical protein CEXT_345251 [Caerostris extrusa]|uniref:Uncharacterized protein n=1 Tax=Caerostris extrusa TaxID=172846 RepID=A0AAV4Y0J7_CAEEX|nr:hypothetical protein CEXT_345251 [Caerostris extrusa]
MLYLRISVDIKKKDMVTRNATPVTAFLTHQVPACMSCDTPGHLASWKRCSNFPSRSIAATIFVTVLTDILTQVESNLNKPQARSLNFFKILFVIKEFV